MKTPAALVVALVCLSLAFAQHSTTVPVEQEPFHHKIIDNEFTRVYAVEVPPAKQTLEHKHSHDYVFVIIGDSDTESTSEGKPPVRLQLKDGDARFAKAPLVHVARNRAETPFRNITIEILNDKPSGEDTATGEKVSNNGYTYRVLVDNDKVRVLDYAVASGSTIEQHTHKFPHVAIALNEMELTNNLGIRLKAAVGNANFIPAGVSHSLKNTGSSTAHFVTVEFK